MITTKKISNRRYVTPVNNSNDVIHEYVIENAYKGSTDSLKKVIRKMEKLYPYGNDDLGYVKECVNIINNTSSLLNESQKSSILSEMVQAIKTRKLSEKSLKYINKNLGIANESFKEFVNETMTADRILRNRDKIMNSKSCDFGLRIPRHNGKSRKSNDIILGLIESIDMMNMDDRIKANACLENIKYELDSRGIPVDDIFLTESVFAFFANKNMKNKDILKEIVKENQYVQCNGESIDFIDSILEISLKKRLKNSASTFKALQKRKKEVSKPAKSIEVIGKLDQQDFRDPAKIKNWGVNYVAFVQRLLMKSDSEIITGIPHILKIFKWACFIGLAAQGLAAAFWTIPIVVASCIISNKMNREHVKTFIKKYESDIEAMEKKLDKAKSEEQKKSIQKGIDALEDGLSKLKDYEDSLYTEKENDKRLYGESFYMETKNNILEDYRNAKFEEDFPVLMNILYEEEDMTEEDIDKLATALVDDEDEEEAEEIVNKAVDNLDECEIVKHISDLLNAFRRMSHCIIKMAPIGPLSGAGVITILPISIADVVIKNGLSSHTVHKIIDKFEDVEEDLHERKNYSDEEKARLQKFIDSIETGLIELKCYEQDMYNQSKNAERSKDLVSEASMMTVANDLFHNILCRHQETLYDFMGEERLDMVSQIYKAKNILEDVVYQKFQGLIQHNAIQIAKDEDVENFLHANIEKMSRYVSNSGSVNFRLATFLPMNVPELSQESIRDYLECMCNAIQSYLQNDFCVLFDGDDELYRIELVYGANIKLDKTEKEEVKLDESVIQDSIPLALVEESYEQLANNMDMDKFIMKFCENLSNMKTDEIVIACESILEANVPYIIEGILEQLDTMPKQYLLSNKINKVKTILNKEPEEISGLYELAVRNYNLLDTYQSVVNEASIMTMLKTSLMKFKKKIQGVNDKQKDICRRMDNEFEKFVGGMQKTNIEKAREKVIKGNKIPSITSLVKLGTVAGIGLYLNPVVTAIGAIGALAVSRHTTKQQKQEILDEIDINLKMVEKKIQLADSNSDMKSMEQLLKIERKLKREKQRIIYNMKHYYVNVSSEH